MKASSSGLNEINHIIVITWQQSLAIVNNSNEQNSCSNGNKSNTANKGNIDNRRNCSNNIKNSNKRNSRKKSNKQVKGRISFLLDCSCRERINCKEAGSDRCSNTFSSIPTTSHHLDRCQIRSGRSGAQSNSTGL